MESNCLPSFANLWRMICEVYAHLTGTPGKAFFTLLSMFLKETCASGMLEPKATSKIPFFMGCLCPWPSAAATADKVMVKIREKTKIVIFLFIITSSLVGFNSYLSLTQLDLTSRKPEP